MAQLILTTLILFSSVFFSSLHAENNDFTLGYITAEGLPANKKVQLCTMRFDPTEVGKLMDPEKILLRVLYEKPAKAWIVIDGNLQELSASTESSKDLIKVERFSKGELELSLEPTRNDPNRNILVMKKGKRRKIIPVIKECGYPIP